PKDYDVGHRWAVGQMAVAACALELLERRAMKGPWPELAEYDCFACHHPLTQPGRKSPSGRRPGSLAWGTWPFVMPSALAEEILPAKGLPELDKLARLMR